MRYNTALACFRDNPGLHIWMAASSLNVKGNKAIIKNVVLANQLVVPNMETHITLCCSCI